MTSSSRVRTYLLSNTKDRGHDVGRRQQGEDTGINDAQVARAVHLERGVDDAAVGLGPHLARAGRVVQRGGAAADEGLDVGVARDAGARQDLDGVQGLDGGGSAQGAAVADRLGEQLDVERVGEEARGREGRVEGVARGGAHRAARVGVLQAEDDVARVPDELHDGGLGRAQVGVEEGLLLLVAGDDLGRGAGGEVLRAVLRVGRGDDGGGGVGEGAQGQEQEEVSCRSRVRSGAVLLVLGQGSRGEGSIGQVIAGDLVGGDLKGGSELVLPVLTSVKQWVSCDRFRHSLVAAVARRTWSWKFWPTAGRSTMVSTPMSCKRALSPTPEIWRSCGVCSAPAARIASTLTPTVDLAAAEEVVN